MGYESEYFKNKAMKSPMQMEGKKSLSIYHSKPTVNPVYFIGYT